MPELRNGSFAPDQRLDRIYELDWRSLNYTVGRKMIQSGTPVYRPRSYTWRIEQWLDQGYDGACVGFSFAHELTARPQEVTGVTDEYAKKSIYWEAQKIDPWGGGSYPGASPAYEGTSVLAGAQINKRNGFYESYHWALTIEELATGVAYFGPCVIGVDWYDGMFTPDQNGFIHPVGNVQGGHAILVHAIKIVYKSWWKWWARTWADVDWERSYVTLHNSWGKSWGDNGRAKLSLSHLGHLLQAQGEACFPKRTDKRSL